MKEDIFQKVIEQEKQAREFGFYWESLEQLVEQIQSECAEIQDAANRQDASHLQEEVGDLILAAISLAIFCNVDPHKALQDSSCKFQKRYDAMVNLVKLDGREHLKAQATQVLLHYWKRAKAAT